jgi:transcriptional regulator with XRE-family HTH domain
MTNQEKEILKFRFGLAVKKKIEENQIRSKANKLKGFKDHLLIDNLKKLEASSGVTYANLTKIVNGAKNPEFTTIHALIEGLNIKIDEFFAGYYYKISELELEIFIKESKRKMVKTIKKK